MQGISLFQQRLAQKALAVVWQSGPNAHSDSPGGTEASAFGAGISIMPRGIYRGNCGSINV
jgi:hypothetical protein